MSGSQSLFDISEIEEDYAPGIDINFITLREAIEKV